MLAAGVKAGVPVHPLSEVLVSWKEIIEPVEGFLGQVSSRLSAQVEAFEPEIFPYAEYALLSQGKQMRPALVALSAKAAGQLNDSLVTVGVIIEMVHLATLVHDDVMDEAVIRRRRPTLAAHWGNEISVLLGDCLFAHALKLAASFPTPEVCRAVAAATNRVCSGEILQTQQRRNFALRREDYFRVLEMKTAELFALSCDLGAALSGASGPHRAYLHQYGLALGTAYQIYDDCVDLFGSEALVGKSLGTDLASGKLTLPILIALERATTKEQEQLRDAIENWTGNSFPRVLKILERSSAHSESRLIIHSFLDRARQALTPLSQSAGHASLVMLADFLAVLTETLGGCP